jgi:hypothetical protein
MVPAMGLFTDQKPHYETSPRASSRWIYIFRRVTIIDFVQREKAQEKSLRRFLEKRPRPLGVVHNVTLKRCRAFL